LAVTPVRQAHPFDGFDKLTAGRLRMTLSGVEWVRAPSEVEGLALAAARKVSGAVTPPQSDLDGGRGGIDQQHRAVRSNQ
jgi:hypothetical protein